ncbi:MAG: PilZ domain-containing protein [Alphaproteobacteria bacterium]|nr:PilZ domain-containing protein [Alphaproteobacteria bacterium]
MFNKFISALDLEEDAASSKTNREHPRRSDDRCVGVVNGQMHPVENWSKGGMLIAADERLFGIGQDCVFTLKFKLRDKIMEIDHKAKVVRKAPGKIALQFEHLSHAIQTNFQKVVDDYVSQRFVESQI